MCCYWDSREIRLGFTLWYDVVTAQSTHVPWVSFCILQAKEENMADGVASSAHYNTSNDHWDHLKLKVFAHQHYWYLWYSSLVLLFLPNYHNRSNGHWKINCESFHLATLRPHIWHLCNFICISSSVLFFLTLLLRII